VFAHELSGSTTIAEFTINLSISDENYVILEIVD
jgi:hypothetical protein